MTTKAPATLMAQQAYHEAGHAVAALAVGFTVNGIYLQGADAPMVAIDYGPDIDLFGTAENRKVGLAAITMLLAGSAAERRLFPDLTELGDVRDLGMVQEMVQWSDWTTRAERQAVKGWRYGPRPSRPWRERVWAAFGQRAESIVDRRWLKIDRLAQALLIIPQMDGETVQKVLRNKPWH